MNHHLYDEVKGDYATVLLGSVPEAERSSVARAKLLGEFERLAELFDLPKEYAYPVIACSIGCRSPAPSAWSNEPDVLELSLSIVQLITEFVDSVRATSLFQNLWALRLATRAIERCSGGAEQARAYLFAGSNVADIREKLLRMEASLEEEAPVQELRNSVDVAFMPEESSEVLRSDMHTRVLGHDEIGGAKVHDLDEMDRSADAFYESLRAS